MKETKRGARPGPAMDPSAPTLRPTLYPWPIFGWEYHEAILPYGKLWDQTLNRLGLEGWDLVSFIHDESSEKDAYAARAIFKRPRPDLPNEEELRALGFKNPEVWDVWLAEARERWLAMAQGARAQEQGRVKVRTEDEDG
jgi:hypothetical protein